jgi:protein-disulfide isomerase
MAELLNLCAALRILITVGFLAAASCLGAAAETSRLPSRAEIDNAMRRTFGYDPAVHWEILAIRQSDIPDLVDVIVSVNNVKRQHIYFSQRSQNAVIGQIIPFGSDPFAPARLKLATADGPTRGAKVSAISIVEFNEFQCAPCRAAQRQLDKLANDFPQVKYVFQQFPLSAPSNTWSFKAAAFAECAAQISNDAFWTYSSRIFEAQDRIAEANASTELRQAAAVSGLDAEKVATCAAQPQTEGRIRKSLALGKSLEVTEVPTVFVNGRRVSSIAAIPYENLKALVQFEIDHAGH